MKWNVIVGGGMVAAALFGAYYYFVEFSRDTREETAMIARILVSDEENPVLGVVHTMTCTETNPCALHVFAWLYTSKGYPLQGYDVDVLHEGYTIDTLKTDADGRCGIVWVLSPEDLHEDKVTFVISFRFRGSSAYKPSQSNEVRATLIKG
ncbi:MAG: hypothetical protein OCU22_03695 [Canidatus Methanoxibalbensis ujae]|nr:hypothetical protein [Candidatus Methanoxibalbensis ujae]